MKTEMASKKMKKTLLSSRIIREMQIKLAQRYHCIRLPQIKTSANTKYQQECEETCNCLGYLWEYVFAYPLLREIRLYLGNMKIRIYPEPEIQLQVSFKKHEKHIQEYS